jgi:hypothetical protein
VAYRVEVATSASFGDLVLYVETKDNTMVLNPHNHTLLYWRVTAFNEFGAAPASNTCALQFIVAEDGDDATIRTVSLAAGQPEQGSEDNAAGCAGSSNTNGLVLMLAAVTLAAAVVRTRRKHA